MMPIDARAGDPNFICPPTHTPRYRRYSVFIGGSFAFLSLSKMSPQCTILHKPRTALPPPTRIPGPIGFDLRSASPALRASPKTSPQCTILHKPRTALPPPTGIPRPNWLRFAKCLPRPFALLQNRPKNAQFCTSPELHSRPQPGSPANWLRFANPSRPSPNRNRPKKPPSWRRAWTSRPSQPCLHLCLFVFIRGQSPRTTFRLHCFLTCPAFTL